eukprot:CAMPEP_0195596730 /NCGR_PEP_ID=MMETSP0815-20121206/2613_1 /TAXON_ID=97485 /ORGANISM="Prymnesium parvum, Strain Texoma1" /LENGTH=60 /DNA_ID=CAMNT_0040736035 /DNA_START=714 /DNA_END=893 /DNA_ORIENTATION=-
MKSRREAVVPRGGAMACSDAISSDGNERLASELGSVLMFLSPRPGLWPREPQRWIRKPAV